MSFSAILKMSESVTLRFVKLYGREPVLYNPSMDDYKNGEARALAASRIAEALAIPGFGPQYVIIKFKNLRSAYLQELKKIAKSKKDAIGCSADDDNIVDDDCVYVPKVIWFKEMDSFLRPFVQNRSRSQNLKLKMEKYEFENIFFDGSQQQNIHQQNSKIHQTKDRRRNLKISNSKNSSTNNNYLPLNKKEKKSVHHHHHHQQQPSLLSNSEITTKGGERATTIANLGGNKQQNLHTEDAFDCFGKYVASLLRPLPPAAAFTLQQQTLNLILKAQIECSAAGPAPPASATCSRVASPSTSVDIEDNSLSEFADDDNDRSAVGWIDE